MRKPRVLIVEDEAAIAELIAVNLRHNGFDPVWVEGGEAAQREIDAVIGNDRVGIAKERGTLFCRQNQIRGICHGRSCWADTGCATIGQSRRQCESN